MILTVDDSGVDSFLLESHDFADSADPLTTNHFVCCF